MSKVIYKIFKIWFGTIAITYVAMFISFMYQYNRINNQLDILFNECVATAAIYNCIPNTNNIGGYSSYAILEKQINDTLTRLKTGTNSNGDSINEFENIRLVCKKKATPSSTSYDVDNYDIASCPQMGHMIKVEISFDWRFKVPFLGNNSLDIFGGLRNLNNSTNITRSQEVICTAYYPE